MSLCNSGALTDQKGINPLQSQQNLTQIIEFFNKKTKKKKIHTAHSAKSQTMSRQLSAGTQFEWTPFQR